MRQVRLHNLMLASDSPRSALKISDFEYSKTEQVRCCYHAYVITQGSAHQLQCCIVSC